MNLLKQQSLGEPLPCSTLTPTPNTALVVEGGGQRGIFTAGILDHWLAKGFNPFSLLIGTSAGAQNIASYLSQQKGYAKRAITRLSNHDNFYNIKNFFSGRSPLDLDWYFKQISKPAYQLNTKCAQAQLSQRKVMFVATKSDDFSPVFLQPSSANWLTLLKASSAIPYLYKKGVKVNGQRYVDGGVVEPIPVKKAFQQGAKKVIVIRTQPTEYEVKTPWAHKLQSWVCTTQRCPRVLKMLTTHEDAYAQSVDLIQHPPEGVEVIELAPPNTLQSQIISSSKQALQNDYEMGMEIGKSFLNSEQALLFK